MWAGDYAARAPHPCSLRKGEGTEAGQVLARLAFSRGLADILDLQSPAAPLPGSQWYAAKRLQPPEVARVTVVISGLITNFRSASMGIHARLQFSDHITSFAAFLRGKFKRTVRNYAIQETRSMAAVEVTYRVGQIFWPSPYYQQIIARIQLSPDKCTLIIETTDNRSFTIAMSEQAILTPL